MLGIPQGADSDRRLLTDLRRGGGRACQISSCSSCGRASAEVMALLDRAVAIVNTSDFEGLSNTFWRLGHVASRLCLAPMIRMDWMRALRTRRGSPTGPTCNWPPWPARPGGCASDQRDLARRCRLYVLDNHRPETIYKEWFDALGVPRVTPAPEPAVAEVV